MAQIKRTPNLVALGAVAAGGGILLYEKHVYGSPIPDVLPDNELPDTALPAAVESSDGTTPTEQGVPDAPPAINTTAGWNGPAEEHPAQVVPKFPNNTAGHVAYAKWIVPVLIDLGMPFNAAVLFSAHLARETGYGKAIWNYNIGNIKAGSHPSRPWFWLTDARGFRDKYRWYGNSQDGVADAVRLVSQGAGGRYKDAWQMLLSGDPNWYGKLGLLGYYEGPPDPSRPGQHTNHTSTTIIPVQNEYNGIVANMIKYLQKETSVPIPAGLALPSFDGSMSITPLQWLGIALVAGGAGVLVWNVADAAF